MPDTNQDAPAPDMLALAALAWTVGDPARARRLLDVTGLDPQSLRARADEPAVLAAVLAFLESHEPDLLACADALGVPPATLVAIRAGLEHAGSDAGA